MQGVQRGELGVAQQELLHLDNILSMPEFQGQSNSKLRNQVVALNQSIKGSQKEIREAEAKLINGDLSREQVQALKQAKVQHGVQINEI